MPFIEMYTGGGAGFRERVQRHWKLSSVLDEEEAKRSSQVEWSSANEWDLKTMEHKVWDLETQPWLIKPKRKSQQRRFLSSIPVREKKTRRLLPEKPMQEQNVSRRKWSLSHKMLSKKSCRDYCILQYGSHW